MNSTLQGQTALVTGASRGIGHATAIALAKAGAHVVAIARTQGGLEEVDDAIKAAGGTATLVPLDLKDYDGIDRLGALYSAIDLVRRGGTISLSGVYGGMADPMPMMTLFDKQIQLRMGQANVKRWVPDILPLLTDDDPLGVETFHTHALPLAEAPAAYETFQKKQDGMVKVVLKPGT